MFQSNISAVLVQQRIEPELERRSEQCSGSGACIRGGKGSVPLNVFSLEEVGI